MKVLIDIQVKQLNEKQNKTENEILWLKQFEGYYYEFWLYFRYDKALKDKKLHNTYSKKHYYNRDWISKYEERYNILCDIENKIKYNKILKKWEKRFLRKWKFIEISDTSII